MFHIGNSGVFQNQNKDIKNPSNAQASNRVYQALAAQSQNIQSSGSLSARGVEILKGMLAGDVFTGEVTDLDGNQVVLKLPDGAVFSAALLDNANVSVGQNLTFMISENTEKMIAIKPIDTLAQESVMIGKALDAAGVIFNDRNINVVKELLTHNMPIDKDTINEAIKNCVRFPKTDMGIITSMMKLGIPMTEENIHQFEAYKSYEHSITGELNQLGTSFGELLSQTFSKDTVLNSSELLKTFTQALYGEAVPNGNDKETSVLDGQNNRAADTMVPASSSETINTFTSTESRQELAQMIKSSFGAEGNLLAEKIQDGSITAKEVFDALNQLMKNLNGTAFDEKSIKKMFGSKEFGDIIKQSVRDSLKISPEDVREKDGIKDFYKRVSDSLEKMSESVSKLGKDSGFEKNLNNIKSNIDFMNDLNKNLTYFQMPVKFKSGDANGELYVYTNKKSLANKTDHVSALLHLDMDHLGSVDVFVKLAGKNVSTNFCLESEEMLDFVYEHIEELNQRLEQLGYQVTFEMKVRQEEDSNTNRMSEFLESGSVPVNTSQYVFDIKA